MRRFGPLWMPRTPGAPVKKPEAGTPATADDGPPERLVSHAGSLSEASPDRAAVPAVAAHRRHLAHLPHSGSHRLFPGIEMNDAEVGLTASALTVGKVAAFAQAAGAALIFLHHGGAVLHVHNQVVTLGNAVLATANFLALIA